MPSWDKFAAHVRFADVLDVLVASLLVYFALKWAQHRSSRTGALAVVVLVLAYTAARGLGMYLTLAVFQVGFGVMLIALVVVFQQDIRNWFERLSSSLLFQRQNLSDLQSVDPLIEAVEQMTEQHIGALIVLGGRQPIDFCTRGGVLLQGRVSVPLLQSIFHPGTMGHDGAVVVRDGSIERFSVHLPLSRNLKEVGSRGMRHTAALGLSECCDALTIVVSEERGTISVAEHGRIKTLPTAAALKTQITEFYQNRFPPRRSRFSLRGLLRDMGRTLTAVGLALMLWFFLAYRTDTVIRTAENVDIEFRNVPSDWIIANVEPTKLKIRLTGHERAFENFRPDNLTVSLDMHNLKEGEKEIVVTERHLNLPPGVSLRPLDAPTITFHAYRVVPAQVRVVADKVGTLPMGKQQAMLEIYPSEITLLVPQKDKDYITEIRTEPIYLFRIWEDEVLEPKLILPPLARHPSGKQPRVRVVVRLQPHGKTMDK